MNHSQMKLQPPNATTTTIWVSGKKRPKHSLFRFRTVTRTKSKFTRSTNSLKSNQSLLVPVFLQGRHNCRGSHNSHQVQVTNCKPSIQNTQTPPPHLTPTKSRITMDWASLLVPTTGCVHCKNGCESCDPDILFGSKV